MNFWGGAGAVLAYGIGAFVYFLCLSAAYEDHKNRRRYKTPSSFVTFAITVTVALGFLWWLFS
jgi:hypothetical protein